MNNPYQILGLSDNATQDEIKQAYRKLAMKHHPDRGGDEAEFKRIAEAYDLIKDKASREAYESRNEHRFDDFFYKDTFKDTYRDIFDEFKRRQPNNVRMVLWVKLEDVAQGGKRIVSVQSRTGIQAAEISVPTDVNDGDVIRFAQVTDGIDLIITFRIFPNDIWARKDLDLIKEVTIDFWDLILGTDISVTTITNQQLKVKVPPRSQPGTILRIPGKGLRSSTGSILDGNMYVHLKAKLPDEIPDDIINIIKNVKK